MSVLWHQYGDHLSSPLQVPQDNDWNYTRAGQVFTTLNVRFLDDKNTVANSNTSGKPHLERSEDLTSSGVVPVIVLKAPAVGEEQVISIELECQWARLHDNNERVRKELQSEKVEQIKQDLSAFCLPPVASWRLMTCNVKMPRTDKIFACLPLCRCRGREHCPRQSCRGVVWTRPEAGTGWEVCSNKNPLCTTYPDKSTTECQRDRFPVSLTFHLGSSILELFPKYLRLGEGTASVGKLTTPSSGSSSTTSATAFRDLQGDDPKVKAVKDLMSEESDPAIPAARKTDCAHGSRQVLLIHDSGDRQDLLGAYHDEACFSLTIPFNPEDQRPLRVVQLLKHTKRDMCATSACCPKLSRPQLLRGWTCGSTRWRCFHLGQDRERRTDALLLVTGCSRSCLRIPDTLAPSEPLSPLSMSIHQTCLRRCVSVCKAGGNSEIGGLGHLVSKARMAAWISLSRKCLKEEVSKMPIRWKFLKIFVANEALRGILLRTVLACVVSDKVVRGLLSPSSEALLDILEPPVPDPKDSLTAACEDGDRSLPSRPHMGELGTVTKLPPYKEKQDAGVHTEGDITICLNKLVPVFILHRSSSKMELQHQMMLTLSEHIWTTFLSPLPHSAPYAIPPSHWRGNFQEGDQTHVNMETEEKPPERRVERSRRAETMGSWFKITIPFGIKYEEKWLLNLIQKHCSVPFTPVEFHYKKMQAQFFVENANIAFALKNVSGKICTDNNERISVFVDPCDAPYSMRKELQSEKVEQIKLTMSKLFDASQAFLNSQRLCFGSGMAIAVILGQIRGENMPKILSLDLSNKKPYQLDGRANSMQNTSDIKNLNVSSSEVKSSGELDKGQRLEQDGMCAEKNPLCTTYPDKSTNISSILELFPKLLRLDGQETPPPAKLGVDTHKSLPACEESSEGSDELKSLILQFLQQYYLIHDSGDRQDLLVAYHDEACFSLTIPFNPEDPAPNSLREYVKDSRNMKKLKDPYLRVQLLKHTKRDIVRSLCLLPKTQHDLSSFVVDMWLHTNTMLCFSVNGVFKEGECV
ncbi:Nuclear RNA export factor 3 [Camelus dromedarius]|uniref:Nuclear RNA export factor 3 n=1 Tax=Camelus dromedarius TaxID=9838 RepID=A0A5N4C1D9_CAMDR|nr:Nuclear RNA export factor 3 [Camelus dromedarius]